MGRGRKNCNKKGGGKGEKSKEEYHAKSSNRSINLNTVKIKEEGMDEKKVKRGKEKGKREGTIESGRERGEGKGET